MTDRTDKKDMMWNQDEIAGHLRSAVDTLTPDVFDKIDLTTPQEIYVGASKTIRMYRRMRTAAVGLAACLCMAVLGGGISAYQNRRVDSVIGIDVNPSIELSVNRRDKVLKAEPLNGDAEVILDDMNLEQVDLDIAVNALVGSMVRHGYLNEMDNAILVTVSNEDREKASVLRQDVVVDIEESLEEHKVQAVVYDQEVTSRDEVRELADEYGISYGKAYFLQELAEENDLSEEELEAFAAMTMEEIAREIAERSYTVRQEDPAKRETASQTGQETEPKTDGVSERTEPTDETETDGTEGESESEESASAQSGADTAGNSQGNDLSGTSGAETTAAQETEEEISGSARGVKIDYVDFEAGSLNIVFQEKVKWKSPTVSVRDENGQSYSAMITDTGSDSCEVSVRGVQGGLEYTFTLGGVASREGGAYGTVRGYFEAPDIAEELLEESEEDWEDEEEEETTKAAVQTEPGETSQAESQSVSEETSGDADGASSDAGSMDASDSAGEAGQDLDAQPESGQSEKERSGKNGRQEEQDAEIPAADG